MQPKARQSGPKSIPALSAAVLLDSRFGLFSIGALSAGAHSQWGGLKARSRRGPPSFFESAEGLAVGVPSLAARHSLPAFDGCVDIKGIEFNPMGMSARPLGGEDGCPASYEGIQNNVTSPRTIEDGIGHEGDWLSRRVQVD